MSKTDRFKIRLNILRRLTDVKYKFKIKIIFFADI